MKAQRGPVPSLIGGTHGKVSFHVAQRKSECRRCKADMPKGTDCVRVARPGKMGPGRSYCRECFTAVLDQTQRKLAELRRDLSLLGATA